MSLLYLMSSFWGEKNKIIIIQVKVGKKWTITTNGTQSSFYPFDWEHNIFESIYLDWTFWPFWWMRLGGTTFFNHLIYTPAAWKICLVLFVFGVFLDPPFGSNERNTILQYDHYRAVETHQLTTFTVKNFFWRLKGVGEREWTKTKSRCEMKWCLHQEFSKRIVTLLHKKVGGALTLPSVFHFFFLLLLDRHILNDDQPVSCHLLLYIIRIKLILIGIHHSVW